jgi:hypothetical protein
MLEQSNIPRDSYFVGDIASVPKDKNNFEYIFLLGVTTYFEEAELNRHFDFIEQNLSNDGVGIISFTNKSSFDYRLRKTVRFVTRTLGFKKNVIGQEFGVFAYSVSDIEKLLASNFKMLKTSFLNQTIPPFNQISPKMSIKMAKRIKRKLSNGSLLSFLSSDFIVFFEKKST